MITDIYHLTESDLLYMHAVFAKWIDRDLITRWAKTIEFALNSYNVEVRVIEANQTSNKIHFVLGLMGKSNVEDVYKLKKELALYLATPRGSVVLERTRNPRVIDLFFYRYYESVHHIPAEFNLECKPVGIIKRFFAMRYFANFRHFYIKAKKAKRYVEYLNRIKEHRNQPFGTQPSSSLISL